MSKALAASLQGNSARLRRQVVNARTRRSIARYGRKMSHAGATGVHIVPSYTLKEMSPGYFGAGIYILGTSHAGRIKSQDTVYIRLTGDNAVIADDQPAEDW